jgi:hypothetical protein
MENHAWNTLERRVDLHLIISIVRHGNNIFEWL